MPGTGVPDGNTANQIFVDYTGTGGNFEGNSVTFSQGSSQVTQRDSSGWAFCTGGVEYPRLAPRRKSGAESAYPGFNAFDDIIAEFGVSGLGTATSTPKNRPNHRHDRLTQDLGNQERFTEVGSIAPEPGDSMADRRLPAAARCAAARSLCPPDSVNCAAVRDTDATAARACQSVRLFPRSYRQGSSDFIQRCPVFSWGPGGRPERG